MRALTLIGAILSFGVSVGTASAQESRPATAANRRSERLQTLAYVWSALALYHPALPSGYSLAEGTSPAWDSVFMAAVPLVERARSRDDFVEALNTALFARLRDPLSYVQTDSMANRYRGPDVPGVGTVRSLAPAVAYIDGTQRFAQAAVLEGEIVAGITAVGPIEMLIVDLRWQRRESGADAGWLGLWTDTTRAVGSRVSRLHEESERWQISALRTSNLSAVLTLQRRDQTIRTPTLFLVNRTSFDALAPFLDALQSRSDIAVAFEADGPAPLVGDVLSFPEGIRVRISSRALVSQSGTLGARPDSVLAAHVEPSSLPSLARALLARPAERPSAHPGFTPVAAARVRYPETSTPLSREERILGLAKVWTTLGTFAAYLDYASVRWQEAFADWLSPVEAAQTAAEYFLTLRSLSATLNDSHVSVEHPSLLTGPRPWPPIVVWPVEGGRLVVAAVDSSVRNEAAVGDEVLAVDGVSIAQLEREHREQYSVSHEGTLRRDLWITQNGLRGAEGSTATIRLRNDAGDRDVRLIRTMRAWANARNTIPFVRPRVRRYPGNIDYIDFAQGFSERQFDSLLNTLHDSRGLILDMRSGSTAYTGPGSVVRLFQSRFQVDSLTEVQSSLPWAFMDGGPPKVVRPPPGVTRYPSYPSESGVKFTQPLVVLIDARPQSALETRISALQGRAVYVGTPTAGTNGGTPNISLPGGASFFYTVGRVTNGDGSRFHGVGIQPDIVAENTVESIRAGRDIVLERAMEFLRSLR